MLRKAAVLVGAVMAAGAASAWAQTTGMPSFNAPYRAFVRHEFGGTLSFPDGGDFALEGQYRFGYRTWDIGFRGGFFDVDGPADDTQILAGVTGRNRIITHSEAFPLDGAVIVGVGGKFFDQPDPPGTTLIVPVALSLGRRIDVEDSEVSIVLYGQPTLLFTFANDSDAHFVLGLGADFRLSRLFDLRVSLGLGDPGVPVRSAEGIAVSAVWIR